MPKEERGAGLIWTAMTLTVFLGLFLLVVEGGRYMRAVAVVQSAADAAALAAARRVDIAAWRERGEFVFLPDVAAEAQRVANLNADWLVSEDVVIVCGEVRADLATQTVRVRCAADLSPLFRHTLRVRVVREGVAQARFR